jgi:large subunit ribosomal protein L25
MKSVSISGSLRANVGKKDAKALRVSKSVPCVLYGGKEQIHFCAPATEFKDLIYTPDAHTVKLKIENNEYHAILREAQFHVVTDDLLHVDLFEITPGKEVVMNIPVKTTGTSPGVRAGGRLVKKLKTLKTKALIENMPDTIEIAIDKMAIGDNTRVKDITIKGVTFLNAANVSVISVETTRASASAATAAAATTPGKKK